MNHSQLYYYASMPLEDMMKLLNTSIDGLDDEAVNARSEYKNKNRVYHNDSMIVRLRRSFINPFSIVLSCIAVLSFVVDVILKAPTHRNYISFMIIITMLLVSGWIRFIQELKAKKVSDKVILLLHKQSLVKRNGVWMKVDCDEVVLGDYIRIQAGEQIPADIRIASANECYVSNAAITGESNIFEKVKTFKSDKGNYTNIACGGTSVISGSLEGFIFAIGEDSLYGKLLIDHVKRKQGFDQGANEIAWVLIRFMLLLVPLVFVVSGIMKDNWLLSLLFSLSVAVGLTPELLPMVITACLTKGSYTMSKKKTIVKNVNAMQSFGNMDVLCVDKTGTLTSDTLLLEYYMDILGNEDHQVLDYAYMNSFYQDGMKNYLDEAILDVKERLKDKSHYNQLEQDYQKLDELPFDYSRKLTSVLVKYQGNPCMIVKGNLEHVIKRCTKIYYHGSYFDIEDSSLQSVYHVVDDMLEDGMKVLAIAIKDINKDHLTMDDENDLILVGYIAFFDAPKKSAKEALQQLSILDVSVKVLSGDHMSVTKSICKRLDMDVSFMMTGAEFDALNDNEIFKSVEQTKIFCELTPIQKQKIVDILQMNGHYVGFLGDGLNDLAAVLQADVGICVDSANASLKDAADVILLKKDLKVLESGILEGRKAFANMSKYIKITASSNLGNIIAIVIASVCLPFFPMTSLQLLLLNLLYDGLCLILPWDHVDRKMVNKPLEWSKDTLARFMLWFGPISSFFDILTFIFLYFILCPYLCGGSFNTLDIVEQLHFMAIFQTGWFLESMWTQILILYLLRSEEIKLFKSKPSKPVWIVTIFGIIAFTLLSMSKLGNYIGMIKLPWMYFIFLVLIVTCYLVMITFAKKLYLRKYDKLI